MDATVLLRTEQSDDRVGIVAVTVPAGWPGPPLHHHAFDEAFYVLDGELTLKVGPDGEKLAIGPGTFACVPPGVVHGFANESDASVTYLNYHAPSTGFAAYLRGERDDFDQHDPPADGGLPLDRIVLRRS